MDQYYPPHYHRPSEYLPDVRTRTYSTPAPLQVQRDAQEGQIQTTHLRLPISPKLPPAPISLPPIMSLDQSHANGQMQDVTLAPIVRRKGYYRPEIDAFDDREQSRTVEQQPIPPSTVNEVPYPTQLYQLNHFYNEPQIPRKRKRRSSPSLEVFPPSTSAHQIINNSYPPPPPPPLQSGHFTPLAQQEIPPAPPPPAWPQERQQYIHSHPTHSHTTTPSVPSPQREDPPPVISPLTDTISCICKENIDFGNFMIACDICGSWYHGSCVGIPNESDAPQSWICGRCNGRGAVGSNGRGKASKDDGRSRKKNGKEELVSGKKKRQRRTTLKEPMASLAAFTHEFNHATPSPPLPPPVNGTPTTHSQPYPPDRPLYHHQHQPRPPSPIPPQPPTVPSSATPSYPVPKSPRITSLPPSETTELLSPWDPNTPHTFVPITEDIISPDARPAIAAIRHRLLESKISKKITSALWNASEEADDDMMIELEEEVDVDGPGPPTQGLGLTGLPNINGTSITMATPPVARVQVRQLQFPSSSYQIRPPQYSLHCTSRVPADTFLTLYTSEVVPANSYLSDPLNAYLSTGLPKPYVRLMPHLALDARKVGNDARWARRGCHPNAVLRPMLCSKTTSEEDGSNVAGEVVEEEGMKFALFTTRDVAEGEEIIIGWEWDDGHVIHELPGLIDTRYAGLGVRNHRRRRLKATMKAFLESFSSSYQFCACGSHSRDCAVNQLAAFVENRESPPPPDHNPLAKRKPDLGALVGVERGVKARPDDKGVGLLSSKASDYETVGQLLLSAAQPTRRLIANKEESPTPSVISSVLPPKAAWRKEAASHERGSVEEAQVQAQDAKAASPNLDIRDALETLPKAMSDIAIDPARLPPRMRKKWIKPIVSDQAAVQSEPPKSEVSDNHVPEPELPAISEVTTEPSQESSAPTDAAMPQLTQEDEIMHNPVSEEHIAPDAHETPTHVELQVLPIDPMDVSEPSPLGLSFPSLSPQSSPAIEPSAPSQPDEDVHPPDILVSPISPPHQSPEPVPRDERDLEAEEDKMEEDKVDSSLDTLKPAGQENELDHSPDAPEFPQDLIPVCGEIMSSDANQTLENGTVTETEAPEPLAAFANEDMSKASDTDGIPTHRARPTKTKLSMAQWKARRTQSNTRASLESSVSPQIGLLNGLPHSPIDYLSPSSIDTANGHMTQLSLQSPSPLSKSEEQPSEMLETIHEDENLPHSAASPLTHEDGDGPSSGSLQSRDHYFRRSDSSNNSPLPVRSSTTAPGQESSIARPPTPPIKNSGSYTFSNEIESNGSKLSKTSSTLHGILSRERSSTPPRSSSRSSHELTEALVHQSTSKEQLQLPIITDIQEFSMKSEPSPVSLRPLIRPESPENSPQNRASSSEAPLNSFEPSQVATKETDQRSQELFPITQLDKPRATKDGAEDGEILASPPRASAKSQGHGLPTQPRSLINDRLSPTQKGTPTRSTGASSTRLPPTARPTPTGPRAMRLLPSVRQGQPPLLHIARPTSGEWDRDQWDRRERERERERHYTTRGRGRGTW